MIVADHPCPFPAAVVDALQRIVPAGLILDPFAGEGGIHRLACLWRRTVGVELEPEFARAHPDTIVGDAAALPFPAATFDAVSTSPCYGNRFADQFVRPDEKTYSYAHSLGRRCSPGSGAALQWGPEYRALHERAVVEMVRVVKPGGLVVVNMKNHRRKGRVMPVVEWWVETLATRGLAVRAVEPVARAHGIGFVEHPSDELEQIIVTEVTA